MAEITVKTEPGYEMHSTLEDQQTQQEESKDTTSFCYETVTKEEVILEDEFVSPEEESATKQDTTKYMFCEECNKSFTNRALFRTHKYKHKVVKEGKYTCQICDKSFRDKYALTIHLQGIHLVSKLTKNKKNEELNDLDVKQFPKTITNENGEFKCTECDERFEFQYLQQRHIRRHSALKQELYKCEECNKAFATPREIKSHLKRAHEKHAQKSSEVSVQEEDGVFICSKCNRTFEERHLCQRHILRHLILMKERVFTCSKCPKKFISEKYLEKHEAWHEVKAARVEQCEMVKCDECNREFRNKLLLSRHIRRHKLIKEGKFLCEICDARYTSKRSLTKHAEKHKKNPELPSFEPPVVIERNNHSAFKCPDCGMVFTVRRAYDNHAQRHVNLRNGTFKCDICEKVCGSDNNLYNHMRRHRIGEIKEVSEPRDLPFDCPKCDKKFGKKHLLKRHTKVHEAIEKGLYKCKTCLKYLGSAASLAIHEQGHNGKTAKD